MIKVIIQQPNDKLFTYSTKEFKVDNNFISFTDIKGQKRLIPLHRVLEVIEDVK